MSDDGRPGSGGEDVMPIRVSRFQLAVLALMTLATAAVYPALPARIPQHWNAAGQIDRWADKSLASAFFPVLIAAGMILLAWALPRLDPLKRNYARFAETYYFVFDLLVCFFAFIDAVMLYAAFHPGVPTAALVPAGVGLLLAVLGNRFGKMKRNFFMGIRTPWTLASEEVWRETHRTGGRLFVVGGLAGALCAFLPAPVNFIVFMVVVLGCTLATLPLSYFIYRRLEREGRLGQDMQTRRPA